ENSALTFTVSGTDEDGTALTYSAANLPTGASFNTGTRVFSWTSSYSQAGSYSPIFTVSDGSLTSSETVVITVTNVNRRPTLTPIGSKSVNENSALTFTVSGTDEDGTALTYSAANLPTGASFNTGTRVFSWTPGYSQSGSYSPIFTVSDGSLTSSETVVITVNNVLRTFVITASAGTGGSINPSGGVNVTEGSNRTFEVTAEVGYSISNVLVDGVSQGGVSAYTFSNVTAVHTIEASFSMTLPSAPSDVAAISASTSRIEVTWTDNAINETGYRIQRSLNGTSSWTTIATPSANAVNYGDSVLSANTTYYYRICAFNAEGDSAYSSAVSATTLPNVVRIYSINAIAGVGGTIEPSGLIEVTEGGNQVFCISAESGYEITSIKVDGVTQGAAGTYSFSSISRDHSIEALFEKVSVAPLGPEKPMAGAFSGVSSTVIVANWASGGSGTGTKYYCENTTAGTNSGWIQAMSYVNRGLTPDSAYTYRVKARSAEGIESEWTLLGEQKTGGKKDFKGIKVEGRDLLTGDIVSSKLKVSVEIEGAGSLEVLDVYVDGVKMTSAGTKGDGKIKGLEYTAEEAIPAGEHSIRIEAMDAEGNVYERQITGITVTAAGVQQIVGNVLGYPNPYDSNAGNLRISYTLTNDMDVMVYIFNVVGKVVSKGQYMSGTMGGLAGYNEVTWDGKDMFGAKVENGAYLIRVLEKSTSKQLGKCNVMVVKR
ncbi:MAG: putative Ig domain-containing protein, partial [Candidatus Margulisiibacteriota bacterium]